MKEIKIDAYNLGQQFREEGMAETAKMILGESEMRAALLIAIVARTALLLAGAPGGGKSVVGGNAWRLFIDVDEQDFATIPYDSNLQEKELVGGSITSNKTIQRSNGDSYEESNERSVTNIDALITKNTIGIFADELTRINPFALNALLSAPEERRVRTNAGIVELPKFQVMISTMNPSESREATFPVGLALASRHAVGAIAGNDLTFEGANALQQGKIPNPELVKPIATLRQLDILRDTVDTMILPVNNARSRFERVELAASLLKQSVGVTEKGRLHVQIGKVARVLALFQGNDKVGEVDFNQAIRFAMASRIGAKLPDIDQASDLLTKLHEEVVSIT